MAPADDPSVVPPPPPPEGGWDSPGSSGNNNGDGGLASQAYDTIVHRSSPRTSAADGAGHDDDDEPIDLDDPELIAAQRAQLAEIEASRNGRGETSDGGGDDDFDDEVAAAARGPVKNVDESMDDDALAQAIAEQDLPPGVSAAEQQEVMMRLLTQQIRRGGLDRGEDGGGAELSPALEQRLRDFQFAQRKRRETYGNERPWGILGLYDHLGECN